MHQDGRVVKALDLSSNGQMSAWVRTPLLVKILWRDIKTQLNMSPISIDTHDRYFTPQNYNGPQSC